VDLVNDYLMGNPTKEYSGYNCVIGFYEVNDRSNRSKHLFRLTEYKYHKNVCLINPISRYLGNEAINNRKINLKLCDKKSLKFVPILFFIFIVTPIPYHTYSPPF